MSEIKFRPLRYLKSGKIAVASYSQWRHIKVADNAVKYQTVIDKPTIIVDASYQSMNPTDLVYNHKGENIFWIPGDPIEITEQSSMLIPDYREEPEKWLEFYRKNPRFVFAGSEHYSGRGLDCDGVPAFTNYNYSDLIRCKTIAEISKYETINVASIVRWIGWFLYKLENSKLIFTPR